MRFNKYISNIWLVRILMCFLTWNTFVNIYTLEIFKKAITRKKLRKNTWLILLNKKEKSKQFAWIFWTASQCFLFYLVYFVTESFDSTYKLFTEFIS
jgi:hypothetical protein